jgi:ribosomal protein S24E
MKYLKDFGYMSLIQTVSDVNNAFLSRRELTCDFAGLGGKLKTMEAVDMITKEFKLDGKVVISMRLKTHVGMSKVTGIFYVYDDEGLAKKHVNPTIFARLEKTKAKIAEIEKAAAEKAAAEAPVVEEKTEAPVVEEKTEAPVVEEKTE